MVNVSVTIESLLLVALQLTLLLCLIVTSIYGLMHSIRQRSTLKIVLYIGQILLISPLSLCIGIYFFQGWRLNSSLWVSVIAPLIMIGFLAFKDLLLSN